MIRFLKIKGETIDLMSVDEIIDESYKKGDLIIRGSYDVIHSFTLDENECFKLYNYIRSHLYFFKNENNYKTIEYK